MTTVDLINITNITIATASLIVSSFAGFFAWKAYESSREFSFPRRNARKNPVVVSQLSKEAKKLELVLGGSIDRKIYLNLLFDSEKFDYTQPEGEGENGLARVTIWTHKHDNFKENDIPRYDNAHGFELQIEQDEESTGKCGYHRGFFIVQGPFYVHSVSGPFQGVMAIVLTPVHVN